MTSLSEGILPSALGLLNAFLVLSIIVLILYLYRRLVIERRFKAPAPAQAREEGEPIAKEELKEEKTPNTRELAAAVAAVKHHIKFTLGRGAGPSEALKITSYWVLSWLNEATQTLDHNPYLRMRETTGGYASGP